MDWRELKIRSVWRDIYSSAVAKRRARQEKIDEEGCSPIFASLLYG